MTSASEIIFGYVFPGVGVILANMTKIAPLKDFEAAVVSGNGLGDLNPTPWAFMLGHSLGWSAYGILTTNWFVFFADCFGFLIACYLNMGAIKLLHGSHHQKEMNGALLKLLVSQDRDKNSTTNIYNDSIEIDAGNTETAATTDKKPQPTRRISLRRTASAMNLHNFRHWAETIGNVTSMKTRAKTPHDHLVMAIIILWFVVFSTVGFFSHYYQGDVQNIPQKVVGYTVNIVMIFFYGAPLSSMGTVLRTKKSDTIHIPSTIASFLENFLWFCYGVYPENDPFIYVPCGLGVTFCLILFALRAMFPKSNQAEVEARGLRLSHMVSKRVLMELFCDSYRSASALRVSLHKEETQAQFAAELQQRRSLQVLFEEEEAEDEKEDNDDNDDDSENDPEGGGKKPPVPGRDTTTKTEAPTEEFTQQKKD